MGGGGQRKIHLLLSDGVKMALSRVPCHSFSAIKFKKVIFFLKLVYILGHEGFFFKTFY